MRIWPEIRNFASQKFRFTPVIQPSTPLQNVLFCLLLKQTFCFVCFCKTFYFVCSSVVQKVRVCTVDFVSASKNTLLLHVTVCEKVIPRLNKHDDVIE